MFTLKKKSALTEEGTVCPGCTNLVHEVRYEVCSSEESRNLYRCGVCSLMFFRPLFEKTVLAMDSVDDAELFGNNVLKALHEKIIISREIKTVRKILGTDRISVLDVGCGTGWISNIWKSHGADVTGLEASVVRADVAEERYGIPVFRGYVEDFQTDRKFDLVILRHVVEHLEQPGHVLSMLREVLADDGLILIIVPNIDCIGRFLFGTNWTWVLPWHCNFFNPKSLQMLLKYAGFDPEKLYQTASPLWYPESLFRFLPDPGGRLRDKFYTNLSIASLLPFAPVVLVGHMAGISDNLTLFARKCPNESNF